MGPAAAAWAEQLAAWAIPEEILAAAPESPWGFLPGMFEPPAEPEPSPARDAALAALPPGGSVLDVGCGAGKAAFELAPPARLVIGVDASADHAARFAAGAARRGLPHLTVTGAWPDVAAEVPAVDVAVCHHVAYNVADLPAFVLALTRHARRRVVLELSAAHPMSGLAPLWQRFWGLDRPNGPTAADALAVCRELGLDPAVATAVSAPHLHDPADIVRMTRKRLCLTAEHEPEVADALATLPPAPREVWSLAWPGRAP